ncbi:E3 ubiquitin-protein ligase UHRF1-like isoform X1 [Xenia sp. Carnegie-2017]|uniref:E3 ubiquitin-protein ligase UHRF1-like isoform X1 n=1 Tax=Xenia sp. Carnegie-2017 TaxID=2897299 RepID=UPI001F036749|nr:E3 ubiquitin-protein ligase UHRF1-like isoform X1 [Xenia sp. Carnegie-2017]
MSLSEYEKQRLRNIECNRKILESLNIPGLDDLGCLPSRKPHATKNVQGVKRKRKSCEMKRRSNSDKTLHVTNEKRFHGYLTRSKKSRLSDIENGTLDDGKDLYEIDDDDDDPDYRKRRPKFTDKIYGSIPGISVGTVWQMRIDCSHDGVHRPTVGGIHRGYDGCYSIALSGGYEDDLDFGECFTFTGEGGRDLKGTKANPKNLRTAPQSKNQTLTRGNLALTKNIENGKPVRVIRGYKLKSDFAPEEGYRYDGLYTVEKFWEATGLSGFIVYKFALKRCPGQAPPPWSDEFKGSLSIKDDSEIDQSSLNASQQGDEDQVSSNIAHKLPSDPLEPKTETPAENADDTSYERHIPTRVDEKQIISEIDEATKLGETAFVAIESTNSAATVANETKIVKQESENSDKTAVVVGETPLVGRDDQQLE